MKSSSLILCLCGVFFCPLLSKSISSGTIVQSGLRPDFSSKTTLMKRGDEEVDENNTSSNDDNHNSTSDSDNDEENDISDPEANDEDTSEELTIWSAPTLGQIGKLSHTIPTPTVSTLWDAEGNAFVFPSTIVGAVHTPTIFTADKDDDSVIITLVSTYTLWDEQGSPVTIAPSSSAHINTAPISESTSVISIEQSTNVGAPIDPTTEFNRPSIETSASIPEDSKTKLTSTDYFEANDSQNASDNTENYPVIVGGSISALALVIGIGGFVSYHVVNKRRQVKEVRVNSKASGCYDLKEVAKIAAHSPGMNTSMPVKRQPVITVASPLQSFISTSRSISPTAPLINNGLFAPSTTQPTRYSTQSSIGIRSSALEETLIVGFSDFDDRADTNFHRSSTTCSISSNFDHEEPLFVMTALLPYMPQRPNEMLIQSGDEILITEEVGEEWLGGYNQSRDPDTKGYFPRTCVTGTSLL